MAPLCAFIPEYVLQGIIEKGAAPQHVINRCQSTLEKKQATPGFSNPAKAEYHTGPAAATLPRIARTVYDAQNSRRDPPPRDKPLLREGDEPLTAEQDPTNNANECYAGFGKTYDFDLNFFQRNSIDNQGLELDGFVHAGDLYNAFFDGREFIFGDGDGIIFDGFTDELDIIAHEVTHGVVHYSSPLDYEFQSGALNESLADAFGIMVKQWGEQAPQTVDHANWLLGEGIWAEGVNGKALRDMQNPGTAYDDAKVGSDPQPAHWRDFKRLDLGDDCGGVHINSGIPNRAFCLAATMIGGYVWEGAGSIWYRALSSGKLRANATFKEFADLTIKNAGAHVDKIREAWKQVGYPFPEGRDEL